MKNIFSIFMMLVCSACSTMEFTTSGNEVFTVSSGPKSERQVTAEVTKDFYFWGMTPANPEFNLQDETKGLGANNPSYVTIEQSYTFSDILYTFVTLGLYCPVTYRVTLLTSRELK
jgi:hypothetical protein